MTTITKEQAEQVLAALRKQQAGANPLFEVVTGPVLDMEWDWLGHGAAPSIHWEEGPYEWAYLFPFGGVEEEFGFKVVDVSADLPAGVWCEAITSWSISIQDNA